MKKIIITLLCTALANQGCNHQQTQTQNNSSYKLFGRLRSPETMNQSPPTPLPNKQPQPGYAITPPPQPPVFAGSAPGMSFGSQNLSAPSQPIAIQPPPQPQPQLSVSQKPATNVQLFAPEPIKNHDSKEPPLAKNPSAIPTNGPVDISAYYALSPNLAIGFMPYPDGIQWLKQNNFSKVFFLASPGQETQIVENVFQKKGMNIEIKNIPTQMESKEQFTNLYLSAFRQNQGNIFVFDLDGILLTPFVYQFYASEKKMNDSAIMEQLQRMQLLGNQNDKAKELLQNVRNWNLQKS